MSGTPEREPVMSLRGVTKRFQHVLANDGSSFDVARGEVHALLGENGAGKTTLMNIASGVFAPDAGQLFLDGNEVRFFRSPEDAMRAGIVMVHQHFRLIDRFTVAENLYLGRRDVPRLARGKELEQRTRELADRFGIAVDPNRPVAHLSVGEQQRVEILRALSREPEILILDEPTAVLTPQEVTALFAAMRAIRAEGTTIVLITHKLDEVLEIADRVTVMRAGREVGTLERADCDRSRLVQMMIGRDVDAGLRHPPSQPGETVLLAEGTSVRDERGRQAVTDLHLTVRAQEIVGIAGVAGNGQLELSQVLTGLRRPSSGRVVVGGVDLSKAGARDFINAGVGHIPEDRRSTGLVLGQPIWSNAVLKEYRSRRLRFGPVLVRRRAKRFAADLVQSVRLTLGTLDAPVEHLSGGNAQRLLTGREIASATRVLIAVHPTRGLDVAATEQVRQGVRAAREAGLGVLLISEDLDEILHLSDRVAVLSGGRIVGEFPRDAADREQIGLLMGGVTSMPAEATG